MSRTIMIIGFLGIAFFAQVAAHGHMSAPTTRDYNKEQHIKNNPVRFPLGNDFICRNDGALNPMLWTNLTAGSQTSMTWSLEAPHPGDCFAYISYDVSLPDAQKKWFKVAEWNDCNLMNTRPQTFTIPSYLPSTDHAILRWEWYALHLQSISVVEYYSQCSDVRIFGSANGQLPTPQVTIPGHLPMDAKYYRNEFSDPDRILFTGPPVATVGGASWSCVNAYDSSCNTPAPTRNPCDVSVQRCVNETAYQSCGIGLDTSVWYAPQFCGAGQVCRPSSDATRIFCVPPSTPVSTPTPVQPPAESCGSSGSMRCTQAGNGYQRCENSQWSAVQNCSGITVCVAQGNVIYCQNPTPATPSAPVTTSAPVPPAPVTTGVRPVTPSAPVTTGVTPSAPVTTGARPSAPVTSSAPVPVTTGSRPITPPNVSPTPTTPSSGSCVDGQARCVGDSSYQMCGHSQWAPVQSCQPNLSCHPSGTSVYCY